jgi:peptidoglycan/xylan/chitin deacetylase (PgdA/CDA1 family)
MILDSSAIAVQTGPTPYRTDAASARVRWYVKKLLRRTVAYVSTGIGWAWRRVAAPRAPRVRVLTYHRFGDAPYDAFCVRESDFERQMRWLAGSGRAISFAELVDFVAGRTTLRDGAVLVTIDDGCPSFVERALPILRTYRIPSVAFVPAGELADDGKVRGRPHSEQPSDRITARELVDAARDGVTIGSHAWTHASLGRMTLDDARTQLVRSRTELTRHVGAPVMAFAYPFGTRADFTSETARLVRETGYAVAFTSQHGAIAAGSDPFALPRVKVEGGEGLRMFRALVNGGMDAWRWVDRVAWRVQQSER